MTAPKNLFLYEEILLLALREKQGTLLTSYAQYAIAGAVLAELLLERRISLEDSRKRLVRVENAAPLGDPVIDVCLGKIAKAKRGASLPTWVSRLTGIGGLTQKAAKQLCERGILRADKEKIMFLFSRDVYPEVDPAPEKKLLTRLRAAVASDTSFVDPRTALMISLAQGARLLEHALGRKEVKARKQRIEQIVNGEATGKATREAISACEAAQMMAAIMPAILAAGCG
jgi:Golgi phosphoprotein 3